VNETPGIWHGREKKEECRRERHHKFGGGGERTGRTIEVVKVTKERIFRITNRKGRGIQKCVG